MKNEVGGKNLDYFQYILDRVTGEDGAVGREWRMITQDGEDFLNTKDGKTILNKQLLMVDVTHGATDPKQPFVTAMIHSSCTCLPAHKRSIKGGGLGLS
jgi:hypothetical protein